MTPNGLRTALRDLAPEPPEGLGRPETARRRARSIRRRYAAASSALMLAAVAILGVTLTTGSDRGGVTNGLTNGTYPNWPRRGDISDQAVVDGAVDAWLTRVAKFGVTRPGEVRVLWAGGGASPVVVFHASPDRGGERLVAVRRTDTGAYDVYADNPAPLADGVVALHLDAQLPQQPGPDGPCTPYPATARTRLLVVGPPDLRAASWQQSRLLPPDCVDTGAAEGPSHDIPLTDGAGLVEAMVSPYGTTSVHVEFRDGSARGGEPWTPALAWLDSYDRMYAGIQTGPPDGMSPLDWPRRTDSTRAEELAGAAHSGNSVTAEHGRCVSVAAVSLPDNTPVVLCAMKRRGETVAAFWAEGGDRRIRSYVQPYKMAGDFAAVVDGHSGAWLVFVGQPDLRRVRFVEGDRSTPLEVTQGVGWLRLGERRTGLVTHDGFGPDGGFAPMADPGSPLRLVHYDPGIDDRAAAGATRKTFAVTAPARTGYRSRSVVPFARR